MKIRVKALEPRWILVFVFFVAGCFGGGLAIYLWLNINQAVLSKIHSGSSQYKYINPLLAVDLSEEKGFGQYAALNFKLQGLASKVLSDKIISAPAIYFRDIESGLWVDINSDTQFSPGKLLRIPIMIAYYKLAEGDSSILDKEIVYSEESPPDRSFLTPYQPFEIGQSYTIENLIRQMIVYGDNNAANVLFDNIDKNTLHEVFGDLSITFKEEKNTNDFISLKDYSLFFRILYNATYLNREYSEKALALLVEADNTVGLGAHTPKELAIANRYGGRQYLDNKNARIAEMYDCGIFYYPIRPYLLCAVARGQNINSIKAFLSQVGSVVYEEIQSDYGAK